MKKEINKFSNEVVEELKYYVYRLVDPRNGQTFYVGKGKGNRVFNHASGALKYGENDPSSDSIKMETIREIHRAGLDVIHIIHRFGLQEDEAFEVESAVMDCFPGLTNLQGGRANDRGTTSAIILENTLAKPCYEEPADIDYMIIKIGEQSVENCNGSLYEATRFSWKINKKKAEQYKYVLSVINGIVQEVYEVSSWQDSGIDNNRIKFEGKPTSKEIRDIFIDKRIPEEYRKKGQANPVLYKK